MRSLARLIFANPTLLFASIATVVVVAAVVAFVWSERRARALAELSEDPSLAAGQKRRLALVGVVTATLVATAAWWTLFRIHTEPERVVIAVAIETDAGLAHWWQDDRGALELVEQLDEQLDAVGLDPVGFDADTRELLREAGDDPDALLAAARKLEARWLIRGRVRPLETIPLELASFSDYVMSVELELVDAESGEVFEVPDMPARVFLWGDDPSDAVALNGEYVADRLTVPLLASLAAREPLRELTGDRTQMTTEQAMLAAALEPLFRLAESYDERLELRRKDEAEAIAREPENHAALPSQRISGILAEEYPIGSSHDGRLLLHTDPKHITIVPGRPGYTVTSEGEALILARPDGSERELLFEHYNFYSAPAISTDGRVLWTTVANHGASKTLATVDVASGEFRPVLSHATHYYTSPLPAPDGSRALFYSRPGRYAESSIELINRDGSGRQTVVGTAEQAGVASWAADGRSFFIPVGSWERIVRIDVETGARKHILGQDPDAPVEASTEDSPDPDEPPSQPDPATTSRFSAVSVAHDGRHLYVVEQSLDGREWLGRYDLEALESAEPEAEPEAETEAKPSPYVRLAEVKVGRLVASPTAPMVAFEAPAFTAPGDPQNRDQEILVLGPEPGQLRAVTLNEVDDELFGWSRDGRSLFSIQRDREPGSDGPPITRAYRHDIE